MPALAPELRPDELLVRSNVGRFEALDSLDGVVEAEEGDVVDGIEVVEVVVDDEVSMPGNWFGLIAEKEIFVGLSQFTVLLG